MGFDGGERAMERVMVMVGERDVGEVGEFCAYSSLCLRERGPLHTSYGWGGEVGEWMALEGSL